jgi:hypothetical protein
MAWGPVGSRLEAAGADVGFLGWLKGSEDRLPREGLLGRVVPEDFARAIRAVSWLAGLRFRPELVPPQRAGAWGERYSVQSAFLCGALKYSTVAHRNERHGDLEAAGKG